MPKIATLSPAQEQILTEEHEKGLALGLSCEKVDEAKAREFAPRLYEGLLGRKPPKATLVLPSPLSAWYAVCLLANLKFLEMAWGQSWEQVAKKTEEQVFGKVKEKVEGQVKEKVLAKVREKLEEEILWEIESGWSSGQTSKHASEQVVMIKWQVFEHVKNQIWDGVRAQVGEYDKWSVRDEVLGQTEEQIRNKVSNLVLAYIRWPANGQIPWHAGKLREKVWETVRDQIVDKVSEQIHGEVTGKIKKKIVEEIWEKIRGRAEENIPFACPYLYGNLDASIFAFYSAAQRLGVTGYIPFYSLWRETSNYGPIWPLDNWCIISDRPQEIHMANGELHREGGPAILYRDGFSVWALRGVRVSQAVAETRPEDMTKEWLEEHMLKEPFVDIRARILERVGAEVFIHRMGAWVCAEEGDYQLLSIALGRSAESWTKYLKMRNPSLGIWHVEPVPRECTTVREALHARKPRAMRDIPVDDVNGEDWIQQGDVCIWPAKAKSLKDRPAELT